MQFNNTDLCVYYHKFGDQIFYVGLGDIRRPFNFVSRNRFWKFFVKQNKGLFQIEIAKVFNPVTGWEEAKRFERQEILRLQPMANIMLVGKNKGCKVDI